MVFDVDKPVVIAALETLPYDVVVADIGLDAVDVGERIVCSDDELINLAPGDAVGTLFCRDSLRVQRRYQISITFCCCHGR